MKALALSERSEFASAPNAASSGRDREAARTWLAFFLVTFFGDAKKSNSAAGPKPGLPPERKKASQPNTLPPRPRATTRVAPTPSLLRPHSYDLTPTTSLLTPTTSLLTPHPSLLTPTTSPLNKPAGSARHRNRLQWYSPAAGRFQSAFAAPGIRAKSAACSRPVRGCGGRLRGSEA